MPHFETFGVGLQLLLGSLRLDVGIEEAKGLLLLGLGLGLWPGKVDAQLELGLLGDGCGWSWLDLGKDRLKECRKQLVSLVLG